MTGAIGILGGTFDPVHIGHLRLALEMREALALDEVRLVPARMPNLRDAPGASAAARVAMLELATAGTPLVLDTRELLRDERSYTIDTLQSLREEVGNRPLCFILGQDAFNRLPDWHRWSELLNYAHLAVATRPGYAPPGDPRLQELLTRAITGAELSQRPAGGIVLQPIPLLPVAATDLRARLKAGRSIDFLTPPSVVGYIETHHLYSR